MRKLYYDAKLRFGYLMQGIRTRNEFHINDIVEVDGVSYFISNMNKIDLKGNRIYKLAENVTPTVSRKRRVIEVKEADMCKVKCWSNFKRGIFRVYDFNMQYWHHINLRRVLRQ